MSENDVIARIKAGDERELGAIYEKYRQEFISWIIRNYSLSYRGSKRSLPVGDHDIL